MLVYHIAVFTKSHISSLTHIKGPQIWGSRGFFSLWMEQPTQPELWLQVCVLTALWSTLSLETFHTIHLFSESLRKQIDTDRTGWVCNQNFQKTYSTFKTLWKSKQLSTTTTFQMQIIVTITKAFQLLHPLVLKGMPLLFSSTLSSIEGRVTVRSVRSTRLRCPSLSGCPVAVL